jgi:hypothetical protein
MLRLKKRRSELSTGAPADRNENLRESTPICNLLWGRSVFPPIRVRASPMKISFWSASLLLLPCDALAPSPAAKSDTAALGSTAFYPSAEHPIG